MTEQERDAKVSGRYARLAREEPPARLDAEILAAARRDAQSRPAPLVAPTARRRWYVPLAAAAVIVLSAVVTLRMWYEQPGFDGVVLAPEPAPELPKQAEKKAADRRLAPPPEAPPLSKPAPAAAGELAAKLEAEESPEKWLERIAALRREGREREADESLAQFRKRHPDHKVPESALRR